MQKYLLVSLAIVTFTGASCAVTAPYNPFIIPKDKFYSKVKTIALAPVGGIPEDLENREQLSARFESLIGNKLNRAGFSIVPSRETAEIWETMNKQLGGLFDPLTGKREESKFKTVREHTLRELSSRFNADAVLHPNIRVVKAKFAGGRARWHNASESLAPISEGLEGFLATMQVTNLHGSVGALSIFVLIEDIYGVNVYANAGGVQLLAKLSGGKFVPVPHNKLFTDEKRIVAAVSYALGPLVGESMSTETPKTSEEPEP